MDGRDEITWAPRVSKEMIRRLYESDARGLLDEELLDEVGIALYLRVRSILDVAEAKRGRVRCPRCDARGRETIIERPPRASGDVRDGVIACDVCGWQVTWGDYSRSFRRRQLNAGGAVSAFDAYLQRYPLARTPKERLLAIDRLIHAFHYSLTGRPDLPSRPVGVNLIEGRLTDVIAFLNALTYGDASSPDLREGRERWERRLERFREEFLGEECRAPGPPPPSPMPPRRG